MQEVAFVELQVNVLLAPLATAVGDADNVTVGAGAGVELVTATETLARVVPAEFVHLIVNVEVEFSAAVLSLPDCVFPPLQAPSA